jgi:hypothetical protein
MTFDFSFREEIGMIGDILNLVPNANLTFDTIRDNISVDIQYLPDGNAYVPSTQYKQVVLICYLKETSLSQAILETPLGADTQTVYFEGRLINPKVYPLPIQAQGDIVATINGVSGRVVSHRAFSSPSAVNYGYDPVLGQKLAMFVQFLQGISTAV